MITIAAASQPVSRRPQAAGGLEGRILSQSVELTMSPPPPKANKLLFHAAVQLLVKGSIAVAGWHALWTCGSGLAAAPNTTVSYRFTGHIIAAIVVTTLIDVWRNIGMAEHWSNHAHHILTFIVCTCGALSGGTGWGTAAADGDGREGGISGGSEFPRLGTMVAVYSVLETVGPFYQLMAICNNWSGVARDKDESDDDMGVGGAGAAEWLTRWLRIGALTVNCGVRAPASIAITVLALQDVAHGCDAAVAHVMLAGCALLAIAGDTVWSSVMWRSLQSRSSNSPRENPKSSPRRAMNAEYFATGKEKPHKLA